MQNPGPYLNRQRANGEGYFKKVVPIVGTLASEKFQLVRPLVDELIQESSNLFTGSS